MSGDDWCSVFEKMVENIEKFVPSSDKKISTFMSYERKSTYRVKALICLAIEQKKTLEYEFILSEKQKNFCNGNH